MKQLIPILFFIIFIAGCASKKGPYVYEVCVREPSDPSKVISNTTIGFADTTIASLSGTVVDQSLKDFTPFVSVSLQNVKTGEVYNDITDTSGHFSLQVPAGNYNLKTEILHALPLQKNISLKSGEIREMKIALSEYRAIKTYRIESDKKLTPKQLEERTRSENQ